MREERGEGGEEEEEEAVEFFDRWPFYPWLIPGKRMRDSPKSCVLLIKGLFYLEAHIKKFNQSFFLLLRGFGWEFPHFLLLVVSWR